MQRFIRFQTELRSPHNGCRLGVFCASIELQEQYELPDYADELLQDSLDWFNYNLKVPRLPSRQGRPIFWFRTEAEECLERIWSMVAIFNAEGLYVEHRTTLRPGHIVYRDEHQIAAIPGKR
jgi:pyruvate-formate lyase-activating enzyme